MAGLADTTLRLARGKRLWEGLARAAGRAAAEDVPTRLATVPNFGANPGGLDMLVYRPDGMAARPPLVVVLHGCQQSAGGYDLGAGWSQVADRHGFMLLLPQQRSANNPNRCFNWFQPHDVARGGGEAASIQHMIEHLVAHENVDPARVYVTGLSAGGAMAAALLAAYPETFAGGQIIAGLPFGTATNVRQALESMATARELSPRDWGDRVRAASPHRGPWPTVSVWHGDQDRVVVPGNADALAAQWRDVHGLPAEPTRRERLGRHDRLVWEDAAGRPVLDQVVIHDMGHGTPLRPGQGRDGCGRAGPFLLDVGLSSTLHAARAWGLTDLEVSARAAAAPAARPDAPAPAAGRLPVPAAGQPSRPERPEADAAPHPDGLGEDLLDGLRRVGVKPGVLGVIQGAFRSAGLIR